MNENEVREVADRYREKHIPLDSIYLDIDYMERYKDFTVNEETFPEFQKFAEEMKSRHIHLVPIIDAGIKKEEGYPVYEEGKEKGYFCKDSEGNDFVAAVWPGQVMFPDFLRPEVREWFGGLYKTLIDKGIDGFWNDMNEPAIFYSERRLKKVFEKIEDYKGRNLDIQSFFEFKDLIGTIDNNPEDYASFYHLADGRKIRHDSVFQSPSGAVIFPRAGILCDKCSHCLLKTGRDEHNEINCLSGNADACRSRDAEGIDDRHGEF